MARLINHYVSVEAVPHTIRTGSPVRMDGFHSSDAEPRRQW
jgi:hypothetical protein